MSATPDTPAGRATEKVMRDFLARVEQRRLPKPEAGVYNSAYEAVLSAMQECLADSSAP